MADSDSYYVRKRSTRPGKKWMVRVPTSSGRGKVVHFGDSSMQDFTQHKDTDRRERYRNRHQRDNLDDPGSPGFWSWHALWGESSNLNTAFAAAVRRAKKLGGAKRNPEFATGNEPIYSVDVQTLWKEVTAYKDARWGVGNGFLYFKDAERKLKQFKDTITESVILGASGLDEDEIDADAELDARWHASSLAYWYNNIVSNENEIPPIELDEAGQLRDGYHRLVAAVVRGVSTLPAVTVAIRNNPDAGALHERFEELCDVVSSNAALVVDEEAALAGRDPRSPRAFAATDGYVVYVRPKLAEQTVERIDGVLMHELGHVILIQSGYPDHTERECDACAEGAFGIAICYDADDVQTTGLGVRPRPAHLDLRHNPDDEDGCGC